MSNAHGQADGLAESIAAALDHPDPLVRLRAPPAAALAPNAVIEALRSADFRPVLVDVAPIVDKHTLMTALYSALSFPSWFGFNYDALQDALEMLEPSDGRRWVLVFQHYDGLREHDPECAEIFESIVRQVAKQPSSALAKCMLL